MSSSTRRIACLPHREKGIAKRFAVGHLLTRTYRQKRMMTGSLARVAGLSQPNTPPSRRP